VWHNLLIAGAETITAPAGGPGSQQMGIRCRRLGVTFLPMMLVQAAVTPFVARIAEKLGARVLVTTGIALMTTGLTVLASVPAPAPVWFLAVLMGLVGLGSPLAMPPMTAVLLDAVPPHRAGIASGVFNASRQLGGTLAVAVSERCSPGRRHSCSACASVCSLPRRSADSRR
jgi:MFS family permease